MALTRPLEIGARDGYLVGARAIGHFGFFREACRATPWRDAADWLVAQ